MPSTNVAVFWQFRTKKRHAKTSSGETSGISILSLLHKNRDEKDEILKGLIKPVNERFDQLKIITQSKKFELEISSKRKERKDQI